MCISSVVKASVILLPLLGLTWVTGLFAINENTAVFAWLFTLFNSLQVIVHAANRIGRCINDVALYLQGLFFFLFHVLIKTRVCFHS